MVIKKALLVSFVMILAIGFTACGKKMKTVLSDSYLITNPADTKVTYVQNGKVKRGEFVTVLEEKEFGGKKFIKVQIEGVSTSGWLAETVLKEGKLESVVVLIDSDLYMRPSLKSDKVGKAPAGQVAFKLEEKDAFVLIQYPGKEAFIQKEKIGQATGNVVKSKPVTIPGLGKAVVSSSSQLVLGEGRELEFDAKNAFDGSLQTTWCEGKTGDLGIGEYVDIVFEQNITLTEIGIVNGWTKSEETYKVNSRVQQLKIVSSTGQQVVVDLNDNILDYQKSDIKITGYSFRFIITKVYAGKDSDTCISEISLKGEPAKEEAQGDEYD